jgi:hypothetical protein
MQCWVGRSSAEKSCPLTQQEQPTSSPLPVPVLVAVLVCDVAVTDPTTNKKTLIGIFDQIHVRDFPTARPMWIYFKVTDAAGKYKIEVRYVLTDTSTTLAKIEGEMEIKDRLASADVHLPTPPLPIPRSGRYELQIWANEVYLGSTFVDVKAHGRG